MQQYIFRTYLGCVFFAAVSLCGQTSSEFGVVQNGGFLEGEQLAFWVPENWTGSGQGMFSKTGGPVSGSVTYGYANIGPNGSDQWITQTLTVPKSGEYKLSVYVKNKIENPGGSIFQASIGKDSWIEFLVSSVTVNDSNWALATGTGSLTKDATPELKLTIPYSLGISGDFWVSDISLVLQSAKVSNYDQAAALAANGLNNNMSSAAVNTATNIGLNVANGSSTPVISEGSFMFSHKFGSGTTDTKTVTVRTKTINDVTYYYNDGTADLNGGKADSSQKGWYKNEPKDGCSSTSTGGCEISWGEKVDESSTLQLLGSITSFKSLRPSIPIGSVVSSIPMSTVFVNTGLLSTNSLFNISGVKFLHAQIESANSQASVSLDQVTQMKRELKQELAEKVSKYKAVSAKLGVSFEALDLNAFQDMDDLVAGRFNDFVLNQETNIQKLKREFRKDLAWFLHASKSLEQMQAKIENVTKEISNFAEHHNSSIEKLGQKQKAAFSKDLQVCISGLKKALGSLNQVYEKYSKSHDIVVSLKQKIDAQALKTQEILPKLYLLDMENASASLEADLQAELAMMDVLDEEHLVAAKGMDPTRQIMRGSESGGSFDNSVNVWGRALGQYMHQSKSKTSSAFSSGTGGALMGADWKVSKHKLGFATSYMYTYMGQAHKSGHVNINQGGLAPYGSFVVADWKFDASIYGGYTHNNSHRNGLAGTVKYHAYSNSHAWQLAPHLQITYSGLQNNSWWTADPYVMGDYVANWQSSVVEKGSSAYNTKQKASFSGFIRTEAGFSFSETIAVEYGHLVLREKAGWAYQRSLSSSTSSVSVAGTTGAFVVPNNAFIQNLGVAEFAITFISPKKHVPNIEVSYEGQFGSKFISQLGAINLSKDF